MLKWLIPLTLAGAALSGGDAYRDGLKVWRKPGATDGGAACATCHGPDGIELAAFDFDDANVLRRARVHLSEEDSQSVVAFLHTVRERYGFKRLLDPMRDRPLQPMGEVLPGDTPEARDFAFAQELQTRLPALFQGRVETIEQAHEAERQMLELDPASLRIGVPLNRLSEDVAHGNAHASVAQWLPEVAPAVPEKELAGWYAAQDAYLADPTDARLRELIALHERLSPRVAPDGISALSASKYRALLVFGHRLRGGKGGEVGTPGLPNPVWEVGSVARDFVQNEAGQLGFGAELRRRKLAGPKVRDQLGELRVSWLYSGWLLDQGLYRTTPEKSGRRGDWLAESLWLDGPYAVHNVYSVARRQLVISRDPSAWVGLPDRRRLFWDFAALRIGGRHLSLAPKAPEHRKAYMTLTANLFRMNLLLLREDLQKTGVVWLKTNSLANVRELTDFIVIADPASRPATERLRDELLDAITKAKERL